MYQTEWNKGLYLCFYVCENSDFSFSRRKKITVSHMKKKSFLWILFSQVEKEIKEVRENVWAELIFHQFSSHKHRTESSLDQTWKMDHQKKKRKTLLAPQGHCTRLFLSSFNPYCSTIIKVKLKTQTFLFQCLDVQVVYSISGASNLSISTYFPASCSSWTCFKPSNIPFYYIQPRYTCWSSREYRLVKSSVVLKVLSCHPGTLK